MNLNALEEQWFNKWDGFDASIEHSAITPAAPFFSIGSYPPDREADQTILLVGKATHGNWYMSFFAEAKDKPTADRIEERKDSTIDFLQFHSGKSRSFFWALYRGLLEQTGANTVWTNLAKIGVCRPQGENESINPWRKCLTAQADLAQQTLIAEMNEYKPDLVLLVTGNYALKEVVNPVFCPDGTWETIFVSGYKLWHIPKRGGRPAVLRTGHPGFKPKEERAVWVEAARRLLS